MRLGISLPVVAMLTISAGVAAAQVNLEAEQAFRDGKRLMSDKRYAEACDAFATSQRLEDNIATLMSLADCREKNGQLATAWGLFLEAEKKTRADADLQDLHQTADARSVSLESRLSYITINVPDESRLKGLVVYRDNEPIDPGLWNRAVPVDGGQHQVEAKAPGHEPWLTVMQVGPEKDRQAVEVPRFKDLPELAGPHIKPPTSIEPEPGPEPLPPAPEGGTFTTKRTIAVGLAAAGAISFAISIRLWNKAQNHRDNADSVCPPNNCSAAGAELANYYMGFARTDAKQGNFAFAGGVAGIVAGGMLWYIGGPTRRGSLALSPQVGRVTGLALTGAF